MCHIRAFGLVAVTATNEGMQSIELDITDSASIDTLVAQVKAEHPKLNAVILNAGIMRPEEVGNNDVQTAKETIATNLTGVIELNSKLLPIIKANTNPVIMTVSSGLAFVPTSMFPTYCATKAAIHSYTQSLLLTVWLCHSSHMTFKIPLRHSKKCAAYYVREENC
jgi:uncharacterized oxidoreductase